MTKAAIVLRVLRLCLLLLLVSPILPAPAPAQELAEGYFGREQLAQLLAPIALYPDPLLAQVLMASTYPIEVIEAERWLGKNRGLAGDALDRALLEQEWDPSVKALCHFPSILALMSEKIAQTTDLGNAFLAQEGEVMAIVQELRAKAHAQGHLTSTAEQIIVLKKETIIIQPANPRFVYVPYYDPLYVYGPWWYPSHPPYYWAPAGVRIGIGIYYWPRVHFHYAYSNWSYFDWPRRTIYIDVQQRPRYVRSDRWGGRGDRWQHAPEHRRGLSYRDRRSIERYERPGDYPGAHRHDLNRPAERGGDRPAVVDRYRSGEERPERGREKPAPVPPAVRNEPLQEGSVAPRPGAGARREVRSDDRTRQTPAAGTRRQEEAREKGAGERPEARRGDGRAERGPAPPEEKAVDGQPAGDDAGRHYRGEETTRPRENGRERRFEERERLSREDTRR